MTNDLNKTVRLHAKDNVAVAIANIEIGTQVKDFSAKDNVPSGHKIALQNIAVGAPVIKYGQTIGFASSDIEQGEHIHSHNLEFNAVDLDYRIGEEAKPTIFVDPSQRDTFMGYHRDNGKVGTRNYIAVLTSVNCSATAAHMIAQEFAGDTLNDYPNVDGVAAFSHGTGCGMAINEEGFGNLQRVLWGYARNPNVGGVLFVGLGCEVNQIDFLLEAYGIKSGPTVKVMNIQNMGGLRKTVDAGIAEVRAMLPHVNKVERKPAHASELMVALQCGGSDGWSGMTANPALGYASDLLVAQGGTTVLAETPEVYGAQHLLTCRAEKPEIAEKLLDRISWWENYTKINSASMDNNPSPGNKRGGLTTILEKSLGAIAKGGTAVFSGCYKYAEPVTARGFTFMDSPGYDPASVTGQIASGCNIVVFTTGRGSAFGSKPSPTIKVATNTDMFERMPDDMDINAGTIVSSGKSIEDVGVEIYHRILEVASGSESKSESQGLGDHEFVPWQIGAVL